jgi:hypothetical protein
MCRKSTQLDRLLMHWPPGPEPLTNFSTKSSSFKTIFCRIGFMVGGGNVVMDLVKEPYDVVA